MWRRSVDRFCDITKLGPGLGAHRCRLAVSADVIWASLAGKAVPDPDDSDRSVAERGMTLSTRGASRNVLLSATDEGWMAHSRKP